MAEHNRPVDNLPNFVRDPKTIASLPMNLVWELTRRHGNYVVMWILARPDTPGVLPALREQVVNWLACIGVSGDPVDPALEFEEIDGGRVPLKSYEGALWPLSFRNLVELLVTNLPGSHRKLIAELLYPDIQLSTPDEVYELHRLMNSKYLNFLDVDVPGGHFTINPYVAVKAVTDSAKLIVKGQKFQKGTSQSRRRHEDIVSYLRVWDLREGWMQGNYDATAELTFHEIAKVEKAPISTLVTRYQAAFRLITGHEYTIDGWIKLFGEPKVRACFRQGQSPRVSLTRIKTSPGNEEAFPLDSTGEIDLKDLSPDQDVHELIDDIRLRIGLGKSDEAICAELDLKSTTLIRYFRARLSDFS